MKYIYSVEGNIGSGKSTFVEKLKNTMSKIYNYDILYVQEPVDIWETICDKDGKNIIEKYYDNNKKYAFSFQMMAYISRLTKLKNLLKRNNDCIIITERSVYTDRFVFCKMLYDDDKIEEINYTIYLKWFDHFIDDIPISGIIYISTNPEICFNRIKERNRKGENISLEYLQKCHEYHENFCKDGDFTTLTLNGDINMINDKTIYNNWLQIVKNFIVKNDKLECEYHITMSQIMNHPFF